MSWRVCSTPGCPRMVQAPATQCAECARRRQDRKRTRGPRNPYSTPGHRRFRRLVLARDPFCVCPGDGAAGCGRHHGMCGKPARVADHWPRERQELIDAGLDPNDPAFGRGLCLECHNAKTARTRGTFATGSTR